jgi:hypothetical protein
MPGFLLDFMQGIKLSGEMVMSFELSCRRVERFLIFGLIFLAVMSTAVEVSYYLLDHKRLLGLVRQLSLTEEANIPT